MPSQFCVTTERLFLGQEAPSSKLALAVLFFPARKSIGIATWPSSLAVLIGSSPHHCSGPPKRGRLVFTLEWSGAPYGRTMMRARPMSTTSELGHLEMPIQFPCLREKLDRTSEFRTWDLSIPSPTLCRCATLAGWIRRINAGSIDIWMECQLDRFCTRCVRFPCPHGCVSRS